MPGKATRSKGRRGETAANNAIMRSIVLKEPYENVCGYFVTQDGRVWSDKRGIFLTPSITPNGYYVVGLSVGNRKSRTFFVHRLVANAWIKKDDNRPFVNHINGNKLDNNVYNLEFCTSSENNFHAHKFGLTSPKKGEEHRCSKLTEKDVIEIRKSNSDISYLSRKYGVCYKTIQDAKFCITWKHIK